MHPSPVVALRDAYFEPETCRRMMCGLGNWLTGQTTVYRREALLEVGGFDPSLKALNDLLTAHVVASRYGAAFSPIPAGVMRIHEGAFLTETLRNPCVLDQILSNIRARGPIIEPKLFTVKMLDRTVSRFYFASLRLSSGETLGYVKNKTDWPRRFALGLAEMVPHTLRGLRTTLFFIIMRPFDVAPAILYRILGSRLVLLHEFIRGRIPR
jgi:hypothetical protein